MEFLSRDFRDLALIFDVRLCVRPVDKAGVREKHCDAQRVSHRRNQRDCQYEQRVEND